MSSFILNKEEMMLIQRGLNNLNFHIYGNHLKNQISKIVGSWEDLTWFLNKCYQNNIISVYRQYKHHKGERKKTLDLLKTYKLEKTERSGCSTIQLYKKIRCLLYQTEMETKYTDKLNKISDLLAHDIVCNLPEFEKAEW